MVRIVSSSVALFMLGLVAFVDGGVLAEGVGDEDPCRDACQVAHGECLSACGAHTNPMECDAQCREQLEDCNAGCR